jgi:CheY-like chemotaxis protein
MMHQNPIVTLLAVDDDKVDLMALKRSFRELKIANPIVEAHDGIEALACLRGENGFEKVPSPCLVLLDLNMPRMGGIEFLDELRRDPLLRRTLVFVIRRGGPGPRL